MEDKRLPAPPRSKLVNAAVVVIVLVILGSVLFPATVRCRRNQGMRCCQNNLRWLGDAVRMYLADWDDTYPTNRPFITGDEVGPIRTRVKLSPYRAVSPAEDLERYAYGISWVEALYHYVDSLDLQIMQRRSVIGSAGEPSLMRCGAEPSGACSAGSNTPLVSYVLNRNLVEKNRSIIRGQRAAGRLMLAREIDSLPSADLRPLSDTTGSGDTPPLSPFLTGWDGRVGRTNPMRHGQGSIVLFADEHVRWFDVSYFPSQRDITRRRCWDPQTRQWYNYAPGSGKPKSYIGSIAITP